MTEREYIDATNLAKIRAANTIIRDTLPMSDSDTADERAALQALRAWEARLELVVRCSPASENDHG